MRIRWLAAFLLSSLPACSGVLGYDDVTFEDGTGASGGGSGGATSGGAGGVPGTGGSGDSSGTGGSTAGTGGGGGGGVSGGGAGGSGNSGDPFETYRTTCFNQINEYRASIGLSPYQRWTDAESCADGEAKSDSETGEPHGAFPACGESAQNECPGYPSLDSTVTTCLAQMWAEGPGSDFSKHGHYLNMSSTQYSMVACGFHVTSSGSVWAVQDFR